MNDEDSFLPKNPHTQAIASVTGDGAVAKGQEAIALGKGAVFVGRDLQITFQQAAQPDASADALRQGYLAWLSLRANELPLLAGGSGKPVQLSSVYTALLTAGRDDSLANAATAYSDSQYHQADRLSALEALDRAPHLVLMGGPGSGKTTFLNYVALCLAGKMLGSASANLRILCQPIPPEADAAADQLEPQRWTHPALLPVRVVLRDFAASLPAPQMPVNADTMWAFIVGQLPAQIRHYADHLQTELLGKGGLLLLDGLDEVPDAVQRRQQVKLAVQEFSALYRRCRFLVTSRTYAYQRQNWKLDGFAERELLPFTRGKIERFIDTWYRHMANDLCCLSAAVAALGAATLKSATERPELCELATRPLLLTLMARLQTRGGGTLPENREKLYAESVDMLLDEWERHKQRLDKQGQRVDEPSLSEWLNASHENIRREIDKLAYRVHLGQPTLTGTADIRQDELIAALLAASRDRPDARLMRIEEYLRDRAGLLTSHGEGLYQFPHRSFQEYLAACHLARFKFPDELSGLAKRDPNRWREVTLLTAASFRNAPSSIWELVDALCTDRADLEESTRDPNGETEWGALLAGQVLYETALAATDPDLQPRHENKRQRVRHWQSGLLRSTTLPARERALAGDLLAALGETRENLLDVDRMRFVAVPRGPFWMGEAGEEGEEGDEDAPLHCCRLSYDYWIAETPVTVAQFKQFVDLSGDTVHDPDALRAPQNRPATRVSWYEAGAFCSWLTERWRNRLPVGWQVSLASEAEWEKAARGGERIPVVVQSTIVRNGFVFAAATLQNNPNPQRRYPWGDDWDPDQANAELIIGETSTPGCFERGRSPYGCEEMSGNVWEWTRSLYLSYPYDDKDLKREDPKADENYFRVVRGGAWDDRRGDARCAGRDGSPPGGRYVALGFRLVLRSSPV